MAVVSGISLANKSQLLFGASAVVILTAALSVPWFHTRSLVHDYQFEVGRQVADAWLRNHIAFGGQRLLGGAPEPVEAWMAGSDADRGLRMSFVYVREIDDSGETDAFLSEALRAFRSAEPADEHTLLIDVAGTSVYRYARPLRESDMRMLRDESLMTTSGGVFDPQLANPLRAILVVDVTSAFADRQLLVTRVYITSAGLIGGLLAILAFYLILTKLIFRPVRTLREISEKVEAGNLAIRSDIQTGDEFQQLSQAFNAMLDRVEQSQNQLRAMNESLGLKVNELAEANVGLYDLNRYKSEFVANVSHELRTPLNSIIGFAELLEELAREEHQADPKRMRYLQNIVTSGRHLLDMINELLDMAKIESGRMEIAIEPTSVGDLIEGLVAIMRPQAQTKDIVIESTSAEYTPLVETDPGKLQQILYNFLSNAIKFTPPGGTVSISSRCIARPHGEQGVRISVTDSGPGISEDMQDVIFEKFRQLEDSHTRQHTGTGLGLAICRELAEMLGAQVSFTSQPSEGATFFVDVPLVHQPDEPQPLMG